MIGLSKTDDISIHATMNICIAFSVVLVVIAATISESIVLQYNSEITDIIKKLVNNIPNKIIHHGGSFEVPTNKYIQGKVSIADTVTTGLSDVQAKVITYDPSQKLVQLSATFPKMEHRGVYHNNVTVFKSAKRVEDTTDIIATLDGLFISIRCNVDNKHVWNLEANTTAKDGNVEISGFLNDKKLSQELSRKITQTLPDVFYSHERDFTIFFSPILERAINKLYHN